MKPQSMNSLAMHQRRRSKKRGNVLALTLGTLAVILTMVLALHQRQTMLQAALNRAEDNLRAREARNFELRDQLTLGTEGGIIALNINAHGTGSGRA